MTKSEILQYVRNNDSLKKELKTVRVMIDGISDYQHCFASSLKKQEGFIIMYKSKYFKEENGIKLYFFIYKRPDNFSVFQWKKSKSKNKNKKEVI